VAKKERAPTITSTKLSEVDAGITAVAERTEIIGTRLKSETDPEKIMQMVIAIEGQRIALVQQIWGVVKNLAERINEEAVKTKDIRSLAVVMGILTDKAQIMTGGPTQSLEIKSGKKMSAGERIALYKQLGSKPGRPRGGGTADE
jgi:hypothetical protein